ncbi:uncharacterized protein BDZ99DRAFT_238079 [Mytilinidion resinicola]|uniref:Uncharacterized protein n=1 Tax=Mytilinidion resinicola TaxID=574789 RepID=A0A6A6YZW3_9PEZI|nr:uncharacterized protein BDZ99DRAFT_238079 [Mytilinidion resinicola]KAF2814466.1 hypothetical protein BDZ99DRAFT_238079 [Mytilinidion resinicola]
MGSSEIASIARGDDSESGLRPSGRPGWDIQRFVSMADPGGPSSRRIRYENPWVGTSAAASQYSRMTRVQIFVCLRDTTAAESQRMCFDSYLQASRSSLLALASQHIAYRQKRSSEPNKMALVSRSFKEVKERRGRRHDDMNERESISTAEPPMLAVVDGPLSRQYSSTPCKCE